MLVVKKKKTMCGSVEKLRCEFVCKVGNKEAGRVEMEFHLEPQRLINPQHIFNAGHALQGCVLIIHLSTSECAVSPPPPEHLLPHRPPRLQTRQAIRESEQECDS